MFVPPMSMPMTKSMRRQLGAGAHFRQAALAMRGRYAPLCAHGFFEFTIVVSSRRVLRGRVPLQLLGGI
jgi:hypothetical protein